MFSSATLPWYTYMAKEAVTAAVYAWHCLCNFKRSLPITVHSADPMRISLSLIHNITDM